MERWQLAGVRCTCSSLLKAVPYYKNVLGGWIQASIHCYGISYGCCPGHFDLDVSFCSGKGSRFEQMRFLFCCSPYRSYSDTSVP